MERHASNALYLAQQLEHHAAINTLKYPFLPSHPQYDIAVKQMKNGGGIVCFELKGGIEAGRKFLDKLQMLSLTANLGDTRSIASHPASTTHAEAYRRRTPGREYNTGANPDLRRARAQKMIFYRISCRLWLPDKRTLYFLGHPAITIIKYITIKTLCDKMHKVFVVSGPDAGVHGSGNNDNAAGTGFRERDMGKTCTLRINSSFNFFLCR